MAAGLTLIAVWCINVKYVENSTVANVLVHVRGVRLDDGGRGGGGWGRGVFIKKLHIELVPDRDGSCR